MRKKLLIALGVLVGLFGIFAAVVAMQPSDFKVQRSTTIDAPPAVVFDQVNDFHKWDAWSPWTKLDPNSKTTFEGPSSGEGAVFKWAGNDDVGEGDMTIVESKPHERVRIKLHFVKPMEDICDTEFAFKPDGGKTAVTWTMSGRSNFVGKAFCLFMNMDEMVGGDFEKGLTSMKAVAEAEAKK